MDLLPEHPAVGDDRAYYVTDEDEGVHLHLTRFLEGTSGPEYGQAA